MTLINLNLKFNEIKKNVSQVSFTDVQLPEEFKATYENYLKNFGPNGYADVEWAKFSTKIITSSGKTIFLTNYWFYVASELAVYLEGLQNQKAVFEKIYKGNNAQELNDIATSLRKGINQDNESKIKDYFNDNGLSNDDHANFLEFVSDYASWGGGKAIDRKDYYVSPLMQAGNLLAETQSAIAEIALQFAESQTLKDAFKPIFVSSTKSKKSNTLISESFIGSFVYKLINFLVNDGLESPLFQHLIEKNPNSKSYNIEFNGQRLTSIFKISDEPIHENELRRGDKLRFFAEPIKVGTDLYYLSNQWTDGTDSRLDIQTLITIFNDLYDDYEIIRQNESYVLIQTSQKEQKLLSDDVTHLSKPFLLLAGISGTGKTRFVREQAKATGSLSDTYCLTSVRPDWHEPSDILGYISRLGGDGNAEYITTNVLQFIAKSWRAIIDAGLKLSVSDSNGLDTRLTVTGDKAQLDRVLPYWLCLDEMNLAPVEQYFADYLSVLETRVWQWDAEQFDYCCDPLLKSATIKQLADTNKLRSDLGFIDSKYDREWELFCEHGLSLPFNLIVAGTVNMDETTHGFSRKVIDRALSFDFGEFFPNDFDHFFESEATHNTLSYPIYSHATVDDLLVIDSDGRKSIEFLKAVNQVLDNTPFQLAFRALNELLLAVISAQPTDEQQLKAVWDDFLMHKVLPRIEGDHDKLTIHNSTTNNDSLFDELSLVLARELADIWHEPKDSPNARPDLYREKLVAEEDDKVLRITCRSRAKLAWMKGRLERSGFTSFWP